ncbi:MAG: DUF2155 domain-containing protein [Pseudomonadota bacterium]
MKANNIIFTLIVALTLSANQSFAFNFLGDSKKSEPKNAVTEDQNDNQKLTIDKIDQSNFSGTAVLQGLNKVTAKTLELRVKVGGQIEFGKLIIKAKKCWKSPADQRPENKILLEVEELNADGTKKPIFYGWMFSSSPSISGLEHPIYDITAIECKN